MLDFRLETFLAVCREMNFTRAAEALNSTQPAVSSTSGIWSSTMARPCFTGSASA